MATVKGPLFSLAATGSVADQLTYQDQKGRSVVKRFSKPSNPRSPAQVASRFVASAFSDYWGFIASSDKATWDSHPEASAIGAYACFLKHNMRAAHHRDGAAQIWSSLRTALTITSNPIIYLDDVDPLYYVSISLASITNLFVTTAHIVWNLPDSSHHDLISGFLFKANAMGPDSSLYLTTPVPGAVPVSGMVVYSSRNGWSDTRAINFSELE